MLGKHTLLIILLVAALVGPAVYFNGSFNNFNGVNDAGFANGNFTSIPIKNSSFDLSPRGLNQQVSTVHVASQSPNTFNPSRVSGIASPAAMPISDHLILPGTANGPDFNAVPLEFMPVTDLNQILRFDANPSWVLQRWERVSTTSGIGGLRGMRVPLVTGVNKSDLFGSLTYFFDAKQVPQRIAFRGWTGNAEGLISFLSANYNFQKQPTSGAGLYVAKSWRRTTGALYLQHPNVVSATNPTQQVAILLELNNPNGSLELTEEVASMVFNTQR